MPPILPTSTSDGLTVGQVLARELQHIKPTRTLPDIVTRVLSARQQGTTTVVTTGSGPTNNLSGGAIAGIVIGSIAGFLILLWIIRSCINWRHPGGWGDTFEPDNEKPPHVHHYGGSTRYPREIHGHHHRSHSRHSHRSPRRTSVVSVTRPAYVERPRSRSPRTPPAAYYADGRDVRRSSGGGRRYSRGY